MVMTLLVITATAHTDLLHSIAILAYWLALERELIARALAKARIAVIVAINGPGRHELDWQRLSSDDYDCRRRRWLFFLFCNSCCRLL